MATSSDARNPVEVLAEEFLDRSAAASSRRLTNTSSAIRELAGEIRDAVPGPVDDGRSGRDSGDTTGSLAAAHGHGRGHPAPRLGDYRILREIGRGGMGVVYEAEQESLGRRVALKILSAGALVDPKRVRRFEREAKAAAKLHHTNIVPVFGVGRQDGQSLLRDAVHRGAGAGRSAGRPPPAAAGQTLGTPGAGLAERGRSGRQPPRWHAR